MKELVNYIVTSIVEWFFLILQTLVHVQIVRQIYKLIKIIRQIYSFFKHFCKICCIFAYKINSGVGNIPLSDRRQCYFV